MLFIIGLTLLFFLPVVESFNREIGYNLLLISSLLLFVSQYNKKKLVFDWLDKVWFILLIIFSISTIFSWSLSRSFTELLRYFSYFLIFLTIRNYTRRELLIKRFLIPMAIVNSIILSFLMGLYYLPSFELPLSQSTLNLFHSNYGHNRISDLLIFTLPLTLVLLNNRLNTKVKLFWGLLSIYWLIVLVLSGSRAVISSLAFAVFIFLFLKRSAFYKIWSFLGILIALIAIIFLSVTFLFSQIINPSLNSRLPYKGIYKPLQLDQRLDYIKQSFQSIKLRPFLGTGLETFRYVSKMYQEKANNWSWYAHNHYLELFVETGIFGGLFFSLLLFILIAKAYQYVSYDQNHCHDGIFIAILASSIHSFFDYDWHYISIFLLIWISLALIIPYRNSPSLNSRSNNFIILLSVSLILFMVQIFIPINSEGKLKLSEQYIEKKDYYMALEELRQANILDRGNDDVAKKISELNSSLGNQREAHYWNKYFFLLNPYESSEVIKKDLHLYFVQTDEAFNQNDFQSVGSILQETNFYYSFLNDAASSNVNDIYAAIASEDSELLESLLVDYTGVTWLKVQESGLSQENIEYLKARVRSEIVLDRF